MLLLVFFFLQEQRERVRLSVGQALESAGPNARPRRGAPLVSGVWPSSYSVNPATTFIEKDVSAKQFYE